MSDREEDQFEAIGLFWAIAMFAWISGFGFFLMFAMIIVSIFELSRIAYNRINEMVNRLRQRWT
jgi:hypothetical protein